MIKEAVRKLVGVTGYDIVRRKESTARPELMRPLDLFGLCVAARHAVNPDFFFVQVGAYDGVTNDPLHAHVRQHQLRGLLVEPQPELFARLKANYADQPQLRFEQCAVGADEGQSTLYRFAPGTPLPEYAAQLASFSREHLVRHAIRFGAAAERAIEGVTVPVRTLAGLLAQAGRTDCDLLQVDAEGYDAQIVTDGLHAGLRPAVIHFEHNHLSPAVYCNCLETLVAAGYRWGQTDINTLAVYDPN